MCDIEMSEVSLYEVRVCPLFRRLMGGNSFLGVEVLHLRLVDLQRVNIMLCGQTYSRRYNIKSPTGAAL